MSELVKQVSFVTREFPIDQSFEGLVLSRIIESLPSEWVVKVYVIRSRLLSTPIVSELPEVEITLISEPQDKWDNSLLRALRYPLEKLAASESLAISNRLLINTSASNYTFVFHTSPVLEFVSRELEAAPLSKGQRQGSRASIKEELELQVFTDHREPITTPEWEGLFQKAKDIHFSREVFMTEVSKVFGFSSSLKRKYQAASVVTIETIDKGSKNKIVNWSSSTQRMSKSDIFILSSKLSSVIKPIRVMKKISHFFSQSLSKGLNGVFKIGYSALKFVFNLLSIARVAISRRR